MQAVIELGEFHKKVSFTARSGKANAKAGKVAEATAEHESKSSDFSSIEIAAEMKFPGGEPVEPELRYFKREPAITSLVKMRMGNNPLTHQEYTLKLGSSSGIKIKDAAKIDATLSAMKCFGNVSISSEVQNEARRILEYVIDF